MVEGGEGLMLGYWELVSVGEVVEKEVGRSSLSLQFAINHLGGMVVLWRLEREGEGTELDH